MSVKRIGKSIINFLTADDIRNIEGTSKPEIMSPLYIFRKPITAITIWWNTAMTAYWATPTSILWDTHMDSRV